MVIEHVVPSYVSSPTMTPTPPEKKRIEKKRKSDPKKKDVRSNMNSNVF